MERFWSKVDRVEIGCWNWLGAVGIEGYGVFRLNGKNVKAHRYAWTLTHGDPGQKLVLHHCDNPRCVCPEHMYVGTHAQNMKDRNERGRQARGEKITKNRNTARGERVATSKLKAAQVRSIRAAYEQQAEESYRTLALKFNVSWALVRNIIKRRSWKHV